MVKDGLTDPHHHAFTAPRAPPPFPQSRPLRTAAATPPPFLHLLLLLLLACTLVVHSQKVRAVSHDFSVIGAGGWGWVWGWIV